MAAARRRPRRERRREVYVFTEGKVTEPEYVDQLKRRQRTFAVKVHNEHGGPERIVPLAVEHKRAGDRSAEKEGLPPEEWPAVWCMFDRDQHPGIDTLTRQAEEAGVRVAFSHPCFEFWVLLHYVDCGAQMAGRCSHAVERLKPYAAAGKRFSLDDLIGMYTTARDRAQRIAAQHEKDENVLPSSRDPNTTVWALVDFLGVGY
ncbi:MAG TPA: RloB family protein [Mycobacteriales bacterium]|nr:RloB family protein [Mycobacteriales bacterium]